MSAKPKIAPPRTKRPSQSRRYHLADDNECTFDYQLPEWMGGLG
jgi:hypothetical protein